LREANVASTVPNLTVSSEYTVRDQQRMSKAVNYFAWQSRISGRALGSRVLEVGCGLGNFTETIAGRELVYGLDIDENCIALHRQRFTGRPNVRQQLLDALDPAFLDLAQHRFDSIACLNVLEHISDDQLMLQRFHDVLQPGGRVVLLVPAFQALYGPIDHHLGHYRRYTKQSLAATAAAAGLVPRTLRLMNFIGFFGWWANARIFRRTEQSGEQIAVFDRWIVPVQERAEELVEPPLGQSIFAVLEKPR
jgi:2-polyprenyl-3-methyl-5-hydroxy-6-metoxy-1,4-benzoquinol methylase